MATNDDFVQEITVGAGFTAAQVEALRKIFERQEDVLNKFGDLSGADENDTLVADSDGIFQVNAVN